MFSSDGIARSIELSIVAVNSGDHDWNTWLGTIRYYFYKEFEGTNTVNRKAVGTYKNACLSLISTDLTINNADGLDGDSPTVTPNTANSDILLQNSEDERRYGINIYEASQPLIRFRHPELSPAVQTVMPCLLLSHTLVLCTRCLIHRSLQQTMSW